MEDNTAHDMDHIKVTTTQGRREQLETCETGFEVLRDVATSVIAQGYDWLA